MTTTASELERSAVVWTDDRGVPVRLVWRGRRYRVTDRPTVLVGEHPWWRPLSGCVAVPLSILGWRFQAHDDDGEATVFDTHTTASGGWVVVKTWS